MNNLDNLIDRYLNSLWERMPVQATELGIHKYDARLPDFDPDAIDQGYQQDQSVADEFRSLETEGLEADAFLDRQVALANLRRSIAQHEHLRPWQRNPCKYERAVIQGAYSLLERDYAPLEQRARLVLERLRQAPRVLRQGRANLTRQASPMFVDTALKEIAGGTRFVEEVAGDLGREIPAMASDLAEAADTALEALAEYESCLRTLSRSAEGDFAVGQKYYDFLLQDYHLVDIDCQELLALGRRHMAACQEDLKRLAERIEPGRSWIDIASELKRDHPATMDGVLAMYQEEVDLARAFVIEEDLVTMPDEDGFIVTRSPEFVWATIPFGSTHPPRPFEADNTGYWEITPPDPQASDEAQEQRLQGHNRWNAKAIALHEAYPGHHMHYCIVKQLNSKIRRQFVDTVFVEGWGLYTEDLMWEAGYFEDPRVRLIQLVNALWRAVRVVVDVSLHTRLKSVEECIAMLVDVSRLEPVNAAVEVARYAATPTQAASYLLGKTRLMAIRDACRQEAGQSFDLKAFHDELLSYGAISPSLVRGQMLSEE